MHAGLWRAVLEEPECDDHRLVLADWLEDNGERERAEFVHVQVEAALLLCHQPPCEGEELPRTADSMWCNNSLCGHCHGRGELLRQRADELLAWMRAEDLSALWGFPPHETWYPMHQGGDLYCPALDTTISFRRGFVASVVCPLATWLEHGPQVVLASPVVEVRATDREPVLYSEAYPFVEWYRDFGREMWKRTAYHLPDNVFDALQDGELIRRGATVRHYESGGAARIDCSAALVDWARAKAGLPALRREKVTA